MRVHSFRSGPVSGRSRHPFTVAIAAAPISFTSTSHAAECCTAVAARPVRTGAGGRDGARAAGRHRIRIGQSRSADDHRTAMLPPTAATQLQCLQRGSYAHALPVPCDPPLLAARCAAAAPAAPLPFPSLLQHDLDAPVEDIQWADLRNVFVITRAGTLYHSDNGGHTFTNQMSNMYEQNRRRRERRKGAAGSERAAMGGRRCRAHRNDQHCAE